MAWQVHLDLRTVRGRASSPFLCQGASELCQHRLRINQDRREAAGPATLPGSPSCWDRGEGSQPAPQLVGGASGSSAPSQAQALSGLSPTFIFFVCLFFVNVFIGV